MRNDDPARECATPTTLPLPPAIAESVLGKFRQALRERKLRWFFRLLAWLFRQPEFKEAYEWPESRFEGELTQHTETIWLTLRGVWSELGKCDRGPEVERAEQEIDRDAKPWLSEFPDQIDFSTLRSVPSPAFQDLVDELQKKVSGEGREDWELPSLSERLASNQPLLRLRLLRELLRVHECGMDHGVGGWGGDDHQRRLRRLIDQVFPKIGSVWSDRAGGDSLLPNSFMSGVGASQDIDLALLAKLWVRLDVAIAWKIAREFPTGSKVLAPLPQRREEATGREHPRTEEKVMRDDRILPAQHPLNLSPVVGAVLVDLEKKIHHAKVQAFGDVSRALSIQPPLGFSLPGGGVAQGAAGAGAAKLADATSMGQRDAPENAPSPAPPTAGGLVRPCYMATVMDELKGLWRDFPESKASFPAMTSKRIAKQIVDGRPPFDGWVEGLDWQKSGQGQHLKVSTTSLDSFVASIRKRCESVRKGKEMDASAQSIGMSGMRK